MSPPTEILGVEAISFAVALAAFFIGGYVKGAIGFALPLVAVAGGSTVFDAKTVVAMLIIPVLVTNFLQSVRQGIGPLMETGRRFWPTIAVIMLVIALSAQLLTVIDDRVFFLTLGVGVALFATLQLAGWRPVIRREQERPWGLAVGTLSGFYGGLAGIWGPPFVLYVTALGLPKREQVRATGLCFLLGAVILAPAHYATGVFNATTAALSAAMLPAALIGQYLGQKTQDGLDAELFRRITLAVLIIAALNMLRRALF
ncbi:MAG: sulfite exporter TauE/SafE family protein [Pseudomonadota bacterium]